MTATTTDLAKTYAPADVEPQIADRWTTAGAFRADPTSAADPFCILIPPPNVTAPLHIGHALNNTLQDVLVRWHRMRGAAALWMPGTDHAGIATQTVVEKRVLLEEGKRRTDFDRETFVAKIQAWKDEYERRITDQLVAMGCSCDWDRQRFTMDPVCARAVRGAFFRLFKDGLIYRGKRLVNWDPVTRTALADDEVEMQEIDGHFWYLRYPVVENRAGDDGDTWTETGEFCVVATTRPETMLGDTAVAVNPNDAERARFVGRHVRLPIVNRVVPVIGDDYVVIPDPESDDAKAKFASGFLKVTPAHDPNDWGIGQRHELDVINVMDDGAAISKGHGWPEEDFAGADAFASHLLGQDRYEAREAIVSWFREKGLLEEVRPYRHSVGHSYRSHVPVEPYLSDQWYVKVTDDRLAGAALRALRALGAEGEGAAAAGAEDPSSTTTGLRFIPDRYGKTYQLWHENIRDWCISRQLWWGHRIPVWTRVGEPAETYRPGQESETLTRLHNWEMDGRLARGAGRLLTGAEDGTTDPGSFICVRREDDHEVIDFIESVGFTQDPDVLDTWFSSALWPISTMGWPDPAAFPDAIPEGGALLEKFNPSSTLCTAREIITLWVSRMVMFNLYFRGCLPFTDVFVHAMIQDGHGQKMSKSLGNGVDPMDIIHSHGSDAMRFTLASMTTQTQDVRMPVDTVCPHTGETFTPKFITTSAGHTVAAPEQACPTDPKKKMVTSYGVASGAATASDEKPLARNTSEKFDIGRNFANKLWNAVRFALSNLESDDGGPGAAAPSAEGLADRWIRSRLAAAVRQADAALRGYEFKTYADGLYDFIWRELCDWYIEAVKPTVRADPAQRRVLATAIDVSLRLLHPVMPFITEKLWERLNQVAPQRGVPGLATPPSELLILAAWPALEGDPTDPDAETTFSTLQSLVAGLREVRTTNKVPPRQTVTCSVKAPDETAEVIRTHAALIGTLANVEVADAGPQVDRPPNAAATVVGTAELYLHDLIDPDAERSRLEKRRAELARSIQALTGRLNNTGYTEKAPAHLVQQTRDQLAAAEQEAETIDSQLAAMPAS